MSNDLDAMRILIAEGAQVNAQDKRGWSPLHFAAQEHAIEACRLLVLHGADIDIRDSYGKPPLSVAVYNAMDDDELVPVLLELGADPNIENDYGVSPAALARTIADTNVEKYFEGP